MSEESQEKQQYIEGPRQRVSGDIPLDAAALNDWTENLDNMYGHHNWRATPENGNPGRFNVKIAPDSDNPHTEMYSEMARWADQEGLNDHPAMQGTLHELVAHNYEVHEDQPSLVEAATYPYAFDADTETALRSGKANQAELALQGIRDQHELRMLGEPVTHKSPSVNADEMNQIMQALTGGSTDTASQPFSDSASWKRVQSGEDTTASQNT